MKKGDVTFAPSANNHTINLSETHSTATMGHNIVSHHHYPSTSIAGAGHTFDDINQESQFGVEATRELLDDEKEMDQTIATAPTQFTEFVGALESHLDDDDTTTIQSHDSITGAGLLDTTDDIGENHDFLHHSSTLIPSLMPSIYPNRVTENASSVCSVSTAPSTDEASSLGHHNHRRVPSWEVSPHNQQHLQPGGRVSPAAFNLTPAFSPSMGWSSTGIPQHGSTFQHESVHQNQNTGLRLSATANHWSQNQTNIARQVSSNVEPSSPRSMYYRQQINVNSYPYPVQQQRKPHHQPPLPPSSANTPPRTNSSTNDRITRNVNLSNTPISNHSPHRSLQSQHGSSTGVVGGGSSRSSSEVLKTLLRKKACLYEPDTSRAVALATWLVGRELALEYGYFSRQQLQAGVHACVSRKIESGVITRTKVNRCMQIILNSCFHYIIPRSDGSEESGESMRIIFSKVMKNDAYLLSALPTPWDDITIDKQAILAACAEEEAELQKHHKRYETPQSSPRVGSVQAMGSPGAGESVDGDHDSKRAVLLCFNENVRSAEEVFRCHNEFIRDTAHACHLQLSSTEWRLFFGKEASSAKHLWGNVGIPVPHLEGHGPHRIDALGMLTTEEADVFRTSWCSKRYEHDHELCGFGHVEVNGGWLRRNPSFQTYSDEMCQFISTVPTSNDPVNNKYIVVNECPHGTKCTFAHSQEEIKYHPHRYKHRTCSSIGRASGCLLGDICPGFHPIDSYRFPKKSDNRSARYARHGQPQQASNVEKGSSVGPSAASTHHVPDGSPIIYTSPAPFSSYEQHLLLPGLQSLYRRQGAFVKANLRRQYAIPTHYNCFEDGYVQPSQRTPTRKNCLSIVQPPTNTNPATIAELSG